MVSYFVSDGHGLTTRAGCDFIKSLFPFSNGDQNGFQDFARK